MGIFSSLKDKFKPLKFAASNQFVDTMKQSFKEIENVKVQTIERDNVSEEKFNSIVSNGIEMFRYFASDPQNGSEKLGLSAEMFTQALKLKKNKVEPYFYLSYIAYLNSDLELAIKYFHIAQLIDSEFAGLEKLRDQISQLIS